MGGWEDGGMGGMGGWGDGGMRGWRDGGMRGWGDGHRQPSRVHSTQAQTSVYVKCRTASPSAGARPA